MTCLAFSKLSALSIVFSMLFGAVSAQTARSSLPKADITSPSAVSALNNWSTLTESQKVALAPLKDVWGRITPVKKQKWLDIAVGYHLLSIDGQATLHFRMAEWATLTARQREQARLNFTQTKKLSPDDKQAKWQDYQALSIEEKQKLASMNKASRPMGAAPALKPVAKDKLLTTPKTNDSSFKFDSNKMPSRALIVNPNAPMVQTAPVVNSK
jgi:hypothetical protein